MSQPLLFEFLDCVNGSTRTSLGIYCSPATGNSRLLENHLSTFLRSHRMPEQIFVFGTEDERPALQAAFNDDDLKQRLSGLTGAPTLVPIILNNRTRQFYRYGTNWDNPASLDDLYLKKLRQAGMQSIFRAYGGMLHGSDAHHYSKPSGKHSDRFIRAANILQDSSAVTFVSLWVSQYIRPNLKHIYSDTSSIHSIAFQCLLKLVNADPELGKASVDSFKSYDEVDKFPFQDVANSIVLISASTSGDLAKKLIGERRFLESSVITIYFLGQTKSQGIILCDLTKQPMSNPSGFEPIKSYSQQNCDLCTGNSRPTMIVGDQFLLEKPKISAHTIIATDAPKPLRSFMEEFRESNIFRVYRHRASKFETLSMDLSDLIVNSRFPLLRTHLQQSFAKSIPVSTRHVVYSDSEGSLKLAKQIRKYVKTANPSASVGLIPIGQLPKKLSTVSEGSIMVVSDVMTDAHDLMNANRLLRRHHGEGAVVYFVGIVATDTVETYREIRSNLTYGDRGPNTFAFEYLRICHLPKTSNHLPWEREYKTYQQLEALCQNNTISFPPVLAQRKRILECGTSKGLSSDVFLPEPVNGNMLKIRKNFAFFDTNENPDKIIQSTIFATIAIILNALRQNRAGGGVLSNEHYHRTLLHPNNFDRFNDGIIQASIIRAALPTELAFSQDEQLSHFMHDIIRDTLQSWRSANGEACLEFLLGLMTGKISLIPSDLEKIICTLRSVPGPDSVFEVGALFLEQRLSASF